MQQASLLGAADPASKLCEPPYSYRDYLRRPRPARSSEEQFKDGKNELWEKAFAAVEEASMNAKPSEQLCKEARKEFEYRHARCKKASTAVEEADEKVAGLEEQLRLAKEHRALLVEESQAADEALSKASEKLAKAEAEKRHEEELPSMGADDEMVKAGSSSLDAETNGISLDISPGSVPMLLAPQKEYVALIKTSRDGDSDEQTDAGESVEENKGDDFSSSASSNSPMNERRGSTDDRCCVSGSSSPAPSDSPMNKDRNSTDGGISITVTTLAGKQLEIKGLYADMHAQEVALRIAAETGIPAFAVTLDHDGQLLTMDSQMLLRECRIVDGSELLLVKQWGWGKPDMRLLSELSAKWGGSKLSFKSDWLIC